MSGGAVKNAGSDNDLRGIGYRIAGPTRTPPSFAGQNALSQFVVLMVVLFLTAVFLDGPVRDYAQSMDDSVKTWVRVFASIGNATWPLSFGLSGLLLLFLLGRLDDRIDRALLARSQSILTLLTVAVVTSGVAASVIKHAIGRIRPSTEIDAHVLDFSAMAFRAGWAAFPSGHATTAMAAATVLALCFPRFAWGWLAIGGLGALARALAGVHWVSDCLAGAVLGVGVALLLHRRMRARGHVFMADATSLREILLSALRVILNAARSVAAALHR